MFRICIGVALALAAGIGAAQWASPYVGQESRDIKALSQQEVDDLAAGRGMGLAKAAELNGYPGPAHVLAMRDALGLTDEQRAKSEAVFERMQSRAIALGSELLGEERALDALFASKRAMPESLAQSLARIAKLQGDVRQVHLQAHLEQRALLSAEQIGRYNELRGYAPAAGQDAHPHTHH